MLIDFNSGPTIAKVPRRASGSAAYYRPYARFVQADPIGFADGLNLYSYADSDPVNLGDSLGLSVQEMVVTYRRKRDSSGGISWGSIPSVGASSGSHEPEPAVEPEIVVTGTRPKKISKCMQKFLASQGYGSSGLSNVRFIKGMDDGWITRQANSRGHGAITLGRYIYVKPSRWGDITNPAAGPTYFEEVVHSIQWEVSGSVGFGFSYVLGAVAVKLGGGNPHDNHVEAQAIGTSNRLFDAYMKVPSAQRCSR